MNDNRLFMPELWAPELLAALRANDFATRVADAEKQRIQREDPDAYRRLIRYSKLRRQLRRLHLPVPRFAQIRPKPYSGPAFITIPKADA